MEIISPGHLPNNLTIENIKMGNSNIRNPILASFASKLLPYRGLGSGILRAYKAYPDIELINDRQNNLFKAIIKRKIIVLGCILTSCVEVEKKSCFKHRLDFEPDLWIKAESLVKLSNTSSICLILAT